MRKDSANLDFLRAFAVLAVFAAHTVPFVIPAARNIWHLGRVGVLLFFVHTSLVLMMSMERLQKSGQSVFSEFYLRRILRIYPLAIVSVLTVTLLQIPYLPFEPYKPMAAGELVANITLTQNLTYSRHAIPALWSLPLEVQMYVVLPFLFLWATTLPRIGLLFVLFTPLAAVQPLITHRLNVMTYVPCFLSGVLAYRLLSKRRRLPSWLWAPTILLLTAVFVFGSILGGITQGGTRQQAPWSYWVLCLSLGLLVPHFEEIHNPFVKGASSWIAKYSYGIYLSHQPLLWLVFSSGFFTTIGVQLAVLLVTGVTLPVIVYHLVEAPGIRVGARIATSKRLPRQASAGALTPS